MIKRVSYEELLFEAKNENDLCPNLSVYNINDCPQKNIIYTFECDGQSYWKIDLELLNESKMIGHINQFCFFGNGSSKLNESGYVYIISCEWEREHLFELILALIYTKSQFAFDQTSLQSVFDELSEDEKENFELQFDSYLIDEIYELGYVKFNEDVLDFIYMNLDFDAPFYPISEPFREVEDWNECFKNVNYYKNIIDKKWKSTELKTLKKKEYYQKQGCQILLNRRAFNAISKNKEYSLIAIEENEIYSIEFNRTQSYTVKKDMFHLKAGEIIEIDYYTIRKKYKYKLFRSVISESELYNLPSCQWALQKYHSGYEGK